MKRKSKRKCTVCGKYKRTTNSETPFICEYPCLRSKGRSLLLNLDKFVNEKVMSYLYAGLFIGIIIGIIITLIVK